jgi:predicted HicB family RNase H-like nuclease
MRELKYNGYIGSVDLSVEDGLLHGKLLYINDLVTYEAEGATALLQAFQSAVDDYLADCRAEGKSPDVPFKGSFNVRIKSELHRELAEAARTRGRSLNEYVASVLTCHRHVELAERFEASSGSKLVFFSTVSGRKGELQEGVRVQQSVVLAGEKPPTAMRPVLQWQTPREVRSH